MVYRVITDAHQIRRRNWLHFYSMGKFYKTPPAPEVGERVLQKETGDILYWVNTPAFHRLCGHLGLEGPKVAEKVGQVLFGLEDGSKQ